MDNKLSVKKRILIISVVCLAVLFILSAESFSLRTANYKIYSHKLDSEMRIVQVSDLHGCKYGDNMCELNAALDEAEPDIVVLTGDIYDDMVNNDNTRIFLRYASKKYPCYYISGNHEQWSGRLEEIVAEIEGFGIKALEADYAEIGVNEDVSITLFGVSTPQMITTALSRYDKEHDNSDSFSILLSHYPEEIELYRSYDRFDLILCGHAHGGQWRLPFCQNGLYAPGQGIFPKYSGGRFDFDDTTMIVSRGLSRVKEIIPRINNNPELVVIDLCPEE